MSIGQRMASLASGVASTIGNLTGFNKSGSTTTITQNPTKKGGTETTINTTNYGGIKKADIQAMPQLPGTAAEFRAMKDGGGAMALAPRAAMLPGRSAEAPAMMMGGGAVSGFSGGQGAAVTQGAANTSAQNLQDAGAGAQALMDQMAAANLLNMKMQSETATMKMMTDMANAVAKTIKSTGSSVKDLAG